MTTPDAAPPLTRWAFLAAAGASLITAAQVLSAPRSARDLSLMILVWGLALALLFIVQAAWWDWQRTSRSNRVWLIAIVAAALASQALIPESPYKWPLLAILLSLPLIFGLVPRNWLYGLRTPRTLWTSEETWYRQNRISGVALLLFGIVRLVMLAR